jgi:hypothetical protein
MLESRVVSVLCTDSFPFLSFSPLISNNWLGTGSLMFLPRVGIVSELRLGLN